MSMQTHVTTTLALGSQAAPRDYVTRGPQMTSRCMATTENR